MTLALLSALRRRGMSVASAKIGPDYIDPRFHEASTGCACVNLDGWAMDSPTLKGLASMVSADAELTIIEGVMGLFDGPEKGRGSTADIAEDLGLPVVLVVD
ncbi:MAG: cobyrinate a,c-diamide synthase, partial [Solimonas sp.]